MKRLTERLQGEEGITIVTAVALMGVVDGRRSGHLLPGGHAKLTGAPGAGARVELQPGGGRPEHPGVQALAALARVLRSSLRPGGDGHDPHVLVCERACGLLPQPGDLAQGYDSADYAAGRAWKTWVRDDFGTPTSAFFDWAQVQVRPSWDANNNGIVFVRAASTVRGKTRALAAQVQIERVVETLNFPERTVIAGSFRTDNNGNKVIVDTKSTATSPHPVTVRCTNITNDDDCMDYRRNTTPPRSARRARWPAGSTSDSPRFQWR